MIEKTNENPRLALLENEPTIEDLLSLNPRTVPDLPKIAEITRRPSIAPPFTPKEEMVIVILLREPGLNGNEIAKRTENNISTENIRALLKKMVQQGCVIKITKDKPENQSVPPIEYSFTVSEETKKHYLTWLKISKLLEDFNNLIGKSMK